MARPFDARRKVLSLAGARRLCAKARRAGRRVVFTNGCFDLLHPGHVRYLARARAAGDLLVVGLNSDRSVRELKGPGRPVQSEAARAEVLAALAVVDFVVVFDAATPIDLIRALRPRVLAKGADWAADRIVGSEEVIADGGRILRVPVVAGESTTRLVRRAGLENRARRLRRGAARPGSRRAPASSSA